MASRASDAWSRTLGCTWLIAALPGGLRSRDSAPLHVFQESARPLSRIAALSGTLRANRPAVFECWALEGHRSLRGQYADSRRCQSGSDDQREDVIEEPAQTPDPSASEAEGKPELLRTYRNSPPMKISPTDPEAALSSKRGASEFAYYDNYLIDNRSCIIAGVMATPARLSQEIVAARQMLKEQKSASDCNRSASLPTRAIARVSSCPGFRIGR